MDEVGWAENRGQYRPRLLDGSDGPISHENYGHHVECPYDGLPSFHRSRLNEIDIPYLVRNAVSPEIRDQIVRENIPAYIRNRQLREIDDLIYPIRNRYGDYPSDFDRPVVINHFHRDFDYHRRDRIIRSLGLPSGRGSLLELTGYPQGLEYPLHFWDKLQVVLIAEALAARRIAQEMEFRLLLPIMRGFGYNDFSGVGLGGLLWDRQGDSLSLSDPLLDRLYNPLLPGGFGPRLAIDAFLDPLYVLGPYERAAAMMSSYPGNTDIGPISGGRRPAGRRRRPNYGVLGGPPGIGLARPGYLA